MPFALLIIGILLVVVGFQNTHKEFGKQLVNDFSGQNNFLIWVAALGIVGAIGYIKEFQGFSRAFMVLIIVVMLLKNQGVFDKFSTTITQGTSNSSSTVVQ